MRKRGRVLYGASPRWLPGWFKPPAELMTFRFWHGKAVVTIRHMFTISGKTMLAKRMATILPQLIGKESIDTCRIDNAMTSSRPTFRGCLGPLPRE